MNESHKIYLDPAHVHVYGHFLVTILFVIAAVLVIRLIVEKASVRNPFSILLASLFVITAVVFVFQAAFQPVWENPLREIFWLFIAGLPPVLFFVLRARRNFALSADEVASSRAKFDKLKDEFLSVASHELRTPLSVINGFAEILVREKLGPLNDEQKRRVRKILMQGQRLNRIIDELLDLSRIRSGKIECRSDVFDLVPVLKASIDDHQIVCEQQKIELVDELPDVLPDVRGDLERVTQIVVNLLNNAIKYTEPGGRVVIQSHYDKNKEEVRIEIHDTGIGIAHEDQRLVFAEFFRAQHNHGKKYAGSGLGLTIVRQLVEAQGGVVGVSSEGLGKGSTFYFTLPADKNGKARASLFIKPLVSETES